MTNNTKQKSQSVTTISIQVDTKKRFQLKRQIVDGKAETDNQLLSRLLNELEEKTLT